MFQKILQWIRDRINIMLQPNSVKSALKLDVAITPLMADALQKWSLIYTNNSPWLSSEIRSLNLGASIASAIARDVTIEMGVTISGSMRANFLAAQLKPVLNNIRTNTEYASAKGGMWFKPYVIGENITTDFIQADMGYPVAFDANGNMTACVFADQKIIGKDFYTRLEYHAMTEAGYQITNTAFCSSMRDVLGSQVSLSSVESWAELEPEATIINIERPLFAYFKMPFANNIDPTSPLGVSVYSRATQGEKCLMQQADELWSNLLWEFESGKRALYTDVLAFGKDTAGKPLLPDKRLYRLLDLQSRMDGRGLFEDWSPTLREANILNGLDAILRKIEFTCGLSYGIISDPKMIALTATEVKNSKQTYYANIVDTQKSLADAFDQLLYAMDVYTTLYNLAPMGTYKAAYDFDDSIVVDTETQFTQDQLTVGMNTMPKYVFLMRNYGLTEEDARKWVAESQAQRVPKAVQ